MVRFEATLLYVAACLCVGLPMTSSKKDESYCRDKGVNNGKLPHPVYCDVYVHCSNGAPNHMKCPRGLVYDPKTGDCDYSFNVPHTQGCHKMRPVKECTTASCKDAASVISKNMDDTVSPCQDFASYACGGFYRDHTIPLGRIGVGSFFDLGVKDETLMKGLMSASITSQDSGSFENKMKTFYKACLDTATIDSQGLAAYTSEHRAQWPTLNPGWDPASYDLQALVDKYEKNFTSVLFSYRLVIDKASATERYMLQMSQPSFGLSRHTLLASNRADAKVMAYQNYYKDVAVTLGADEATAQADAKDVIDLMRALLETSYSVSQMWDPKYTENPSTLGAMTSDYGVIDWRRAIQSIYDTMGVAIEQPQNINIQTPTYFQNLQKAISAFSKRTIQNLFGFQYAMSVVEGVTKDLGDVQAKFIKVKDGRDPKPRGDHCLNVVTNLYNVGMAKLLAQKRFGPDAKAFMNTMIVNLKAAFANNIRQLPWLSEATKLKALDKLKLLKAKIGVQDQNFETADIDAFYSKFTASPDNFNADRIQNNRENKILYLKDLNEPVQAWKWGETSMTIVNAFYDRQLNQIVFPLGIMQSPFFHQNYPSAMNYGAVGYFIGHEVSHGFDTSGKQFDGRGRLRNWWLPEDDAKFKDQTDCLVKQYSTFHVKQVDLMINGTNTVTENAADNAGYVMAHQAFNEFLASTTTKELPLPGLGLNNKQLFFLSLAQAWCMRYHDAVLRRLMLNQPHSPPRYRIIGIMQNSEEFAKAYKCKKGDFMNPPNKCKIW